MIRTILVGDIGQERERLRMLLEDADINIIAEFENGRKAVQAISGLKPDLVFLDVQMAKGRGVDFIDAVKTESMPMVIFVSGDDNLALSAIEVNAIDYILKPFDSDRLAKAVWRAKREMTNNRPIVATEESLRRLIRQVTEEPCYLKRIPVKSERGTELIPTEEIYWIGSAGHYLEIHLGKEMHVIRGTLSAIEKDLDPRAFMRIHRSTIVNLGQVNSLQPLCNGDQSIILKNKSELTLSRRYYDKLMFRLTHS